MIAIIDYGMGNIHSVEKALQICGAQTLVTNDPLDLAKAGKIVLPGVGAFSDAMEELNKRGLIAAIKEQIAKGKLFLGICLGMQLLFDTSQEAEGVSGLGVIKGSVVRFNQEKGIKVPHIGWNQLKNISAQCRLLSGVAQGACVYFCHSYYPRPADISTGSAWTQYGQEFAAVVSLGNVYGVQFHPEKSQAVGLSIIKNFVGMN